MASGLPDYYRGIRPSYGGALLAWGSKYCAKNVQTTLCGIAGKGMVYGGAVWLDYTSTQSNSEVWFGTDGFTLTNLSFERLTEYAINEPRAFPVSIFKKDSVNWIYSVGISYGITFEKSVVLAYSEKHGVTPTVHYRLVYALI